MRLAVISCGALALHVRAIADRRGWDVDVVPLPPELHNRPEKIAPAVEELLERYDRVVLGYADCGTKGALDKYPRLQGNACYDVFSHEGVAEALEEQPGTYFLTDFLVRSFHRVVWRGLGLDRYPELRDTYFRNYTRVLWLAQSPTPELRSAAEEAAGRLGLPLEIHEVGDAGLERQLEVLVG